MRQNLPNYLSNKEKRVQQRVNAILRDKEQNLKEVYQDHFDLEKDENGAVKETQNNIIRQELNKKLQIYDDAFNNLVHLVGRMIQKIIIVHTEIQTIITITVFTTLLISAIIGGIAVLVSKFL